MKYHALFAIFEKAARFEIADCCKHNKLEISILLTSIKKVNIIRFILVFGPGPDWSFSQDWSRSYIHHFDWRCGEKNQLANTAVQN